MGLPISFDELPYAHKVLPSIIAGVLCFGFIFWLFRRMKNKPTGRAVNLKRLDKLADQIRSGAMAFLREEYKYLAFFVTFTSLLLLVAYSVIDTDKATDGVRMFGAFLIGAGCSAFAGWFGMYAATEGNVRTTVACYKGALNDGLRVAFETGAIMGFMVVALGMTGLSATYWMVSHDRTDKELFQLMTGFGFGASSIALFARVAGGIYTKAADVGADLVGKVESGIDEDDPHNPAVIADNVGDNVGDVAGMGADLFESYVGSIIAACSLASEDREVALPFYLCTAGLISSLIGFFFVKTDQSGSEGLNQKLRPLLLALEKGIYIASAVFLGLAAVCIGILFEDESKGWKLYGCVVIGLTVGILIGKMTEIFTSFDEGPVKSITDRGTTGPATVVIQGLGVGMISTVPPMLILVAAVISCAELGDYYGVSIAAVGMLSTLGVTLATDAYGPVADNAGGLAEMAKLGSEVRAKTDALDALGNTTAAIGKGFAIGSAVLTALSLLAVFSEQVLEEDCAVTGTCETFDITDHMVLSGILLGAMLPYLFAALTLLSVGKAAAEIIDEVRRQFRVIPGLRSCIERASRGEDIPPEEDVAPDSDKCIAISARSSVKEMIAPGLYAILTPIFVGFCFGPRCLMGLLGGSIASGSMLAIMMNNAGGAWDNAKKLCEKKQLKKTDQGKACVVGDTVGDPFKDTAGPALNILIKLMAMVSLVISPLIKGNEDWDSWYYGMIPLALFIVGTILLVWKKVLTWKDPLGEKLTDAKNSKGKSEKEEDVEIVIETSAPSPTDMSPEASSSPVVVGEVVFDASSAPEPVMLPESQVVPTEA